MAAAGVSADTFRDSCRAHTTASAALLGEALRHRDPALAAVAGPLLEVDGDVWLPARGGNRADSCKSAPCDQLQELASSIATYMFSFSFVVPLCRSVRVRPPRVLP